MPLLSSVTSRFPSGDQVAAAVKQGKIALVDEGAVGKDREQDVLALACGFDDVAAKKMIKMRDTVRITIAKGSLPSPATRSGTTL